MAHVPLFWVIAVGLALAVGLVGGGLPRMREQRAGMCGRWCETPSSGDKARRATAHSSGPPPSRASKTGSREADSLSAAWSDSKRYGRLTLVLSPLLLMVKVPAEATGV